MAELLTWLILLGGLLIAASMVHAGRKLKAYLRLRRRWKSRQFRSEWNGRSTAIKTFSRMGRPHGSARPQPAGTVKTVPTLVHSSHRRDSQRLH